MRNVMLASLFLAACGDPSSSEPPVDPPSPTPRVDGVTYLDGDEVTQGGEISLTLAGENLERAFPSIDDATFTRQEGSTYTFTVDPGSPLGPRALVLDDPAGDLVVDDAIVVTATLVDPASGRDDATGTPAHPLRTLAHAVDLQRAPGSQISLAPGTHEVTDGLVVGGGVVITGAGLSSTTISVPRCGTFFYCIAMNGQLSQIRVVSQVDKALAIGEDGLLTDAEIVGGGDGLTLQQRARVERVSVSGASRAIVVVPEDVVVKDCRVSDSSFAGVTVLGVSGAGRFTLEGTTLERNDQGLVTSTVYPVTVVVRGSTFAENRIGVHMTYTDGDLALDMGSPLSPGGNVFTDNQTHITDERHPRTVADGLIATFAGSTFDDANPEGIFVGEAAQEPLFTIVHALNRLSF